MMDVGRLLRPEILTLRPYASAARTRGGADAPVRLHANEGPGPILDPRDEAEARLRLHRYPEPQPAELVARMADRYRVPADHLLVTRGSDEAIDLLVRACCRPGRDGILVTPPTFSMYAHAARIQGAFVAEVPLDRGRGFALDVDAVLAAMRDGVKLVFLCSPNNPTGGTVPAADVIRLADALDGRALVVVDEAYVELASTPAVTELVPGRPGLATLRTLSKAYGLAALRVGALVADPALLERLTVLLAPYPLPAPSVATAIRGLDPALRPRLEARRAGIVRERARLRSWLTARDDVRRVWEGDANFLLVELADPTRWIDAATRAGIRVRDLGERPGLEGCVRITVGSPADNARLLAAIGDEVLHG